jgi:hypothetical protein
MVSIHDCNSKRSSPEVKRLFPGGSGLARLARAPAAEGIAPCERGSDHMLAEGAFLGVRAGAGGMQLVVLEPQPRAALIGAADVGGNLGGARHADGDLSIVEVSLATGEDCVAGEFPHVRVGKIGRLRHGAAADSAMRSIETTPAVRSSERSTNDEFAQ